MQFEEWAVSSSRWGGFVKNKKYVVLTQDYRLNDQIGHSDQHTNKPASNPQPSNQPLPATQS